MNVKEKITINTVINASIERIWGYWTNTQHIKKWNTASENWHTPHAENDLKKGGKFNYRMEAKDGTFGFDFGGTYDEVEINKNITYTLEDERKVQITFTKINDNKTEIVEIFEAENMNPIEMQRNGWQLILDNFKKYVETSI